jgi:hypothetical protein
VNGQAPKRPLDTEIRRMITQISPRRIEASIRKLVSFGTRNTLSTGKGGERGIDAARDWIFDEFEGIGRDCGGCFNVERQAFLQPKANRIPEPIEITNVVATLQGTTDLKRVYVISGHYDSMCSSPTDAVCDAPGANDDASGTAVVIELARVMSKYRFDATIVFIAVAGEEQGLLGSTHFAEQAKQRSVDIAGMLTNDIVGGATTRQLPATRHRVRVFSEGVPSSETDQQAATRRSVGGENDSPSRQLARFIAEESSRYLKTFKVSMIYRRDRYLRGGDHIPFLERGFPAVRVTEAAEDYTRQHQTLRTENGIEYGDTPEHVDYGYVADVARVNLTALASLARAPAAPKNAVVITAKLTNDTELRWDLGKDPDLAGYEIVWRETTEPQWSGRRFVGRVGTYVMRAMSKDNYFFGVRAVDKQGHRSPVAFPRPMRN